MRTFSIQRISWVAPSLAIVALVIFGDIVTAGLSAQSLTPDPQAWGSDVSGLRIGIAAVRPTSAEAGSLFEVSLHNAGSEDFVVNRGYMLANGKTMLPYAVRLILSDSTGSTRELEYGDQRHPLIVGRVDDYIVALRAGSKYMLRLSLDRYWSPARKEDELKLRRGRYRISAQFEGKGAITRNSDMLGVSLLKFWKGTVQSGATEFEVQ
jgi:hypothetical protein